MISRDEVGVCPNFLIFCPYFYMAAAQFGPTLAYSRLSLSAALIGLSDSFVLLSFFAGTSFRINHVEGICN